MPKRNKLFNGGTIVTLIILTIFYLLAYFTGRHGLNFEMSGSYQVLRTMSYLGLIAGALGGLYIGVKNTMLLGGWLMMLASLSSCLTFIPISYVSCTLFGLGSSAFILNLLVFYANVFLEKPKFAFSGFLFFVLLYQFLMEIVSFVDLIVSEDYPIYLLSILSALLSLITILITFFQEVKFEELPEPQQRYYAKKSTLVRLAVYSISIFILYTLYIRYGTVLEIELAQFSTYSIKSDFRKINPTTTLGSAFLVAIFAFVQVVLWSFIRGSIWLKLFLSALFYVGSFSLFILFAENLKGSEMLIYLVSVVLIAMPIFYLNSSLYSTVVDLVNPKYFGFAFAIALGLRWIINRLILGNVDIDNDIRYSEMTPNLYFFIVLSIILLAAAILVPKYWKQEETLGDNLPPQLPIN